MPGSESRTLQANQVPSRKFLTPTKKPDFRKLTIMQDEKQGDFYSDCMRYFDSLRRQGRQDYAFEDEFFYTMPALSEKIAVEK